MKFNSYVEQIQKEASEKFSNYTGKVGRLDAFDRTLTFKITPTISSDVSKAILFGYAYDPTDAKQTNCTVTVLESSHTEVKLDTLNPFRIQGIKYFVQTSSAQFANPFSIVRRTARGSSFSKTWQPANMKNPENNDEKMIVDANFQALITKDDRIELDVNVGEVATIIFYIVDEVRPEQMLNNMGAIATTGAGMPTGKLPTQTVLLPATSLQASPRGLGGYGNFSLADEMNYNKAANDVFGLDY